MKKHLLNSINQTLSKKDIESISSLHRYFDYSLNFIDRSGAAIGGKPLHPIKVHLPELNMAGVTFRLGMIDKALLSVLETIRIAQNKNDHEAILQCLVWLQQILKSVGNKD